MKITSRKPQRQGFIDDSDSGLSLVELIIAAGIFSIISIMVFNVIDSFQTVSTSISARSQASSQTMVALNRMAKDIRNAVPQGTASPIVFASPTQLTFNTTDGNGLPVERDIVATGNAFPYTLSEYTMVSGVDGPLLLQVSNLTNPNVFSYYPAPLGETSFPTTTSVPSTGVTSPAITSIESVGLIVTLEPITNQPSVTVTNTIEMRNVASVN